MTSQVNQPISYASNSSMQHFTKCKAYICITLPFEATMQHSTSKTGIKLYTTQFQHLIIRELQRFWELLPILLPHPTLPSSLPALYASSQPRPPEIKGVCPDTRHVILHHLNVSFYKAPAHYFVPNC